MERSIDWGQWPERVAGPDLAERGLEVGAEGAGPDVGGERRLVDARAGRPAPSCRGRRRRARGWSRRTRRSARPPPSPAPRASLQAASTAATSSVEAGRTTTAGRCGTAPSAAQPMASGHQSRPASARASSSVTTVGPAGGDAVEQRGRDLDGLRPPRRSTTSAPAASIGVTGVGSVTGGRARRSGAPSGTTR